jgi:hypothetical protein
MSATMIGAKHALFSGALMKAIVGRAAAAQNPEKREGILPRMG